MGRDGQSWTKLISRGDPSDTSCLGTFNSVEKYIEIDHCNYFYQTYTQHWDGSQPTTTVFSYSSKQQAFFPSPFPVALVWSFLTSRTMSSNIWKQMSPSGSSGDLSPCLYWCSSWPRSPWRWWSLPVSVWTPPPPPCWWLSGPPGRSCSRGSWWEGDCQCCQGPDQRELCTDITTIDITLPSLSLDFVFFPQHPADCSWKDRAHTKNISFRFHFLPISNRVDHNKTIRSSVIKLSHIVESVLEKGLFSQELTCSPSYLTRGINYLQGKGFIINNIVILHVGILDGGIIAFLQLEIILLLISRQSLYFATLYLFWCSWNWILFIKVPEPGCKVMELSSEVHFVALSKQSGQ